MPPSIQNPQKSVAEFGTCAANERLGIEIPGPRDDGLHGTFEIALGAGSDGPYVAALQMAHDLVEDAHGLAAPLPLRFGAEQVLLRHHFQNGADILRHSAVNQHQALLQLLACGAADFLRRENLVIGQEASAADAELRIAIPGRDPVDELDSGPYAAGILPAAARSPHPLAQNGTRRHQAPLRFFETAG